MAEEIHHPHDLMVRAVLSDLTEAVSFLQTHLPEAVSQALNWSTLKLLEGSFVDEDLRESEADLLYEVEHVSGETSLWVYVLLEHQSTPDRWMRLRLLKYCCRIWDLSFRDYPDQRELRAIVPLVFYQGERSWSYSSEFAELFAESVRDWPGVPRFSHGLIDQSGMQPGEVQGDLKVRIMQLVMLAAYHPTLAWMERVASLLDSLASLPPSGGINYVRLFVLYILATQEPKAAQSFRDVLRQYAPEVGDDLMTYAQELLAQGEIRAQVRIIENLLQEGMEWPVIERVTGVNEAQFQALKQQVEGMNE
jgi:predicted transposase/invertase (TIGR01784 family)